MSVLLLCSCSPLNRSRLESSLIRAGTSRFLYKNYAGQTRDPSEIAVVWGFRPIQIQTVDGLPANGGLTGGQLDIEAHLQPGRHELGATIYETIDGIDFVGEGAVTAELKGGTIYELRREFLDPVHGKTNWLIT